MYMYIYKCINLTFTISNNESFPYFHQKFLKKLCCQKGTFSRWELWHHVLRWWIPSSHLGWKPQETKNDGRFFKIHPWKLTCPPKRDHFNRKYIFQPLIFRGHVSFQGCTSSYWKWLTIWGFCFFVILVCTPKATWTFAVKIQGFFQ